MHPAASTREDAELAKVRWAESILHASAAHLRAANQYEHSALAHERAHEACIAAAAAANNDVLHIGYRHAAEFHRNAAIADRRCAESKRLQAAETRLPEPL
jgi:hypothetical protein